ncbi:hypothetical protein LCGC14_1394680 [marine sediment metagenome]|uniref:Uncharacterized protein n=1 Tax=marine sediment metagenome TaxID=412755 RepID=A0A0F9JZ24_9ZZZZ
MALFKKIKKAAKKAAKNVAKDAKKTFRKTVGRGAKKGPSFKKLSRVVKRSNPVSGFKRVTKALKPKRGRPRR